MKGRMRRAARDELSFFLAGSGPLSALSFFLRVKQQLLFNHSFQTQMTEACLSTESTPRLGDIAIARLGAFSTTEDHVKRKEKDIPTTKPRQVEVGLGPSTTKTWRSESIPTISNNRWFCGPTTMLNAIPSLLSLHVILRVSCHDFYTSYLIS